MPKQMTNLVGKPTDYTQRENWMFLEKNPTRKADLLYFYPTVIMTNNGKTVSDINEELRQNSKKAFEYTASAFASYTNVFAPYYRQIPFDVARTTKDTNEFLDLMKKTEVRTDVYAALDLYFAKYNQERPFIIAGHSQGSCVLKMILEEYMRIHSEYLKQMVVAYMVGFPVTLKWLNNNPHLKFAEGEEDVGGIVSWNTEGPHATMNNYVLLADGICINPLNWKRDETPAGMDENKGSLMTINPIKIGPGIADATIDPKRGVIVCKTTQNYIYGEMTQFFGDKSFHFFEYGMYYENLKENGKKRIDAYFGKKCK